VSLWPIAFLFFFYPSNYGFMSPGRLQVNFDHGESLLPKLATVYLGGLLPAIACHDAARHAVGQC
jgi:hypothetical protein